MGRLDITVDPYSLSTSGGTRIVVFQDVDFNIRRTESFCYGAAA
ncbi:phage major capsid protein [Xylella fastidiosa subsp. multiplex]|uniref:Phage major capsid protein n=1 Tax=Xylella fastidiosa subsp. multiplex TaxID=644357 RepID=A0AAW6HWR6_XYLFS|nr:phage major capsid protein [Xylella fastidiosa subsp. multiplex]